MSRKLRTWLFEGEQRTVAEISAMVPALNKSRVYRGLHAGETTRVEMLTTDARKPRRTSTRFNAGRNAG